MSSAVLLRTRIYFDVGRFHVFAACNEADILPNERESPVYAHADQVRGAMIRTMQRSSRECAYVVFVCLTSHPKRIYCGLTKAASRTLGSKVCGFPCRYESRAALSLTSMRSSLRQDFSWHGWARFLHRGRIQNVHLHHLQFRILTHDLRIWRTISHQLQ